MRTHSVTRESFDLFCPHCNIETEAPVVCQANVGFRSSAISQFDEIDAEYHGDTLYVALCRRCRSPFLIRQSLHGVPGEFETITSEEVLYPATSRFSPEGVPQSIRRVYEQAVRCYGASSFDAAALMCRRTLEATCKELGAAKGSLQAKLDFLAQNKTIDPRLNEWGHGIRAVGNEAAHETDAELSKEDARDVLDFTEAILMYVFILRARYAAFEKRRRKPDAPSPQSGPTQGADPDDAGPWTS